MFPIHKKVPPDEAVTTWLTEWWADVTLYGEPPVVPLRLLLAVTEEVFDDLEGRECDPCMLKAHENGHVIYLRRTVAHKYTLAIDHQRLDEKLKLEQALLLIRNRFGTIEDHDEGPDTPLNGPDDES